MNILTDKQLHELAVIVLDSHGPCLPESELTEQIGLLLEDISGLELASDEVIDQIIHQVKSYYHDADQHPK